MSMILEYASATPLRGPIFLEKDSETDNKEFTMTLSNNAISTSMMMTYIDKMWHQEREQYAQLFSKNVKYTHMRWGVVDEEVSGIDKVMEIWDKKYAERVRFTDLKDGVRIKPDGLSCTLKMTTLQDMANKDGSIEKIELHIKTTNRLAKEEDGVYRIVETIMDVSVKILS